MTTTHADTAIESFLDLERRFEAFVRVVPVVSEHNSVHSPALASILLDACSLVETVLKSSMDNRRYDSIPRIADIRKKRYSTKAPYLTIADLRGVFRADMYYAKPVWYLPLGQSSFPWYVWRNKSGNPKWWTAYNAVKHSRFDNGAKANLMNTQHALKGLFLALAQSLEFRDRLICRGLLRCDQMATAVLRANVIEWEPIPVQWRYPITVRSELFAYKYLSIGSPLKSSDAADFL